MVIPRDGFTRCFAKYVFIFMIISPGVFCQNDGAISWMDWTPWNRCTRSCGGGTKMQMRMCMPMGSNCVGRGIEMVGCNFQPCPQAIWTQWNDWTQCSVIDCKRTRQRHCVNFYLTGDNRCDGLAIESSQCEKCASAIPAWAQWGDWSPCDTSTCMKKRVRECLSNDSGKTCDRGTSTQFEECPLCRHRNRIQQNDFYWHPWTMWSECSHNCTQERVRKCNDQSRHYRQECCTDRTDTKYCVADQCRKPVGNWAQWAAFTHCDCRLGQRTRERICPLGFVCLGRGVERVSCGCKGLFVGLYPPYLPANTLKWSDWASWSACDCAINQRSRIRHCNSIYCHGENEEWDSCGSRDCAREASLPSVWGGWSTWSGCTSSCGGGTQLRYRKCVHGDCKQHGTDLDRRKCGESKCPEWGPWETCSKSCGGGIQLRRYLCHNNQCPRIYPEMRDCNTFGCDVVLVSTPMTYSSNHYSSTTLKPTTTMPRFSKWSDWTECDVTCGGGRTVRTRQCVSHCQDNAEVESKICNDIECVKPYNGHISEWSSWSVCNCYNGMKKRIRLCSSPRPPILYIEPSCPQSLEESVECEADGCRTTNGAWSAWSDWSGCPQNCSNSQVVKDTRMRSCSQPLPSNGGKECTGHSVDKRQCSTVPCAGVSQDGGFTEWSTWSDCDAGCGSGRQHRVRQCSDPRPTNGGALCSGTLIEYKSCSAIVQCSDTLAKGGWTQWTAWSACSQTCGQLARKISFRSCSNPRPKGNLGSNCRGRLKWWKPCWDLPDC